MAWKSTRLLPVLLALAVAPFAVSAAGMCDRELEYDDLAGAYTLDASSTRVACGTADSLEDTAGLDLVIISATERGLVFDTTAPLTTPVRSCFADTGGCSCELNCICSMSAQVGSASVAYDPFDELMKGTLNLDDDNSSVTGLMWILGAGYSLSVGFGEDPTPAGATPVPIPETDRFPAMVSGNLADIGSINSFFTHRAKPTGFQPEATINRNDGGVLEGEVSGEVALWHRESKGGSFLMNFRFETPLVVVEDELDVTLRFVDDDEPDWRWKSTPGIISSRDLTAQAGCDLKRLPRLVGTGSARTEDGRPVTVTYRLVVWEDGHLAGFFSFELEGAVVTRVIHLYRAD